MAARCADECSARERSVVSAIAENPARGPFVGREFKRIEGAERPQAAAHIWCDNGAGLRQRFRQNGQQTDWFSFDTHGVHFAGSWNIGDETTFGVLGQDQLDWLKKDLAAVNKDTPVVVFAHVPLWALYPQWGWVTKDGEQAL